MKTRDELDRLVLKEIHTPKAMSFQEGREGIKEIQEAFSTPCTYGDCHLSS